MEKRKWPERHSLRNVAVAAGALIFSKITREPVMIAPAVFLIPFEYFRSAKYYLRLPNLYSNTVMPQERSDVYHPELPFITLEASEAVIAAAQAAIEGGANSSD